MTEFILNSKNISSTLPPGMTLLDFIRYEQNLKGTKIGCREGDCGACTVLVGEIKLGKLTYSSVTSCLMPLGNAQGKHIVSVEGVNLSGLNPVQEAIVENGGTQCGFCTVGFVMSLVGFCLSTKNPTHENAIAAMDGNICRCTGYKSLERAAESLVEQLKNRNEKEILLWLVKHQFIPTYFTDIPERLKQIEKKINLNTAKQKIAGGTDLYVQKHEIMVHSELDFLADTVDLKGIKKEGDTIIIGASTTVEEIKSDVLMGQLFPNLSLHLKLISSTQIRNMASLAGNFVNASPIGDMTIFFLALNAQISLTNGKTKRTIYLKDFYKGYKTLDKENDEIIESISFYAPEQPLLFNFEKVSKRTNLDIASVNSAIQIKMEKDKMSHVHLACGGVFAFPKYLRETSAFLTGKTVHEEIVHEAAQILQTEIKPISDARGTAEYKKLLARQLFYSHFISLFPNLIEAEKLVFHEFI